MTQIAQAVRFGIAAAVVAALAPGVSQAAIPARPAADQVQAPVPTITWRACEGGEAAWRCATVPVPLDYDNPRGPKAILDLLKIPAANQSQKLGSLFVNPGGPGGSSTDFATYAPHVLGSTVRNRYDVIGIDPRGIGKHSQIICTADNPPPYVPTQSFPTTWPTAKRTFAFGQWMRTACKEDRNAIVNHMSTADTARDMDVIRQAVGDKKLNYYGISYGTQLGSTYASMFPSRVGRFVVDGVLDPVAWSTGDVSPATRPFSTRLRSAKGAHEALMAALDECDRVGRAECHFAGNARTKWSAMVVRAKMGNLTAGGEKLPYPNLISGVLGYLYGQSYSGLDGTLQALWEENFGTRQRVPASAAKALRDSGERVRKAPYMTPIMRDVKTGDGFSGVACADTRNPDTAQDWWAAGIEQDRRWPGFGSLWTWMTAQCAKWPITTKADTWFGPYGARTATPILVVGNTYDPATPIHGARAVANLFTNSRLLTYDGWGHGALGTRCVTRAFDRYYATGALPAAGSVCPMDQGLFAD